MKKVFKKCARLHPDKRQCKFCSRYCSLRNFKKVDFDVEHSQTEYEENISSLDIDPEGTRNILEKLSLLFQLLPNARLSIVDSDYNLIWISPAQKKHLSTDSIIYQKCYKTYFDFENKCFWCSVDSALKSKEIKTVTGILRPKNPLSISYYISDIICLPCGSLINDTYSHCIEIIIDSTERNEIQINNRINNLAFKEAIFDKLINESLNEPKLLKFILYYFLYTSARQNMEAFLFELPFENTFEGKVKRIWHMLRNKHNTKLWECFLSDRSIDYNKIKYTIDRSHPKFEDLGLYKGYIGKLIKGEIVLLDNCKKLAAFIEGNIQYNINNFILMINKRGDNTYVSLDDKVTFTSYIQYCKLLLQNKILQRQLSDAQERDAISKKLFSQEYKNAYVAEMILAFVHQTGHCWDSYKNSTEIIISKYIKNIRNSVALRKCYDDYKKVKPEVNRLFVMFDSLKGLESAIVYNVNVTRALDKVVNRYKTIIVNNNIQLNPPKIDTIYNAIANTIYLEMVIDNLIHNAIYAASQNENPKISINLKKQPDDKIKITVQDNGHGFPHHLRNWIWRSGNSTKKHVGGTGIGLAFVKYTVVQIFSGSVECFSSPQKKKTTFSIILNPPKKGRK